MNFQTLIENAALDSFGLLDRREVELFEQELASAPAAVKASVASLQERLVMIDLPPEITAGDLANLPPADMRERVLATLGTEIAAAAIVAAGGESGSYRFVNASGVNPWWRASAIGAIAAAIVLGVTTVMLRESFREVDNAMQSNAMLSQVSGYGNSFESLLLDPATKFVQFTSVATNEKRTPAAILMYRDNGEAQFVARDLSHELAKFKLIATDEKGEQRTLADISGPRAATKCSMNGMEPGSTLALVPAGQDASKAILKSVGGVRAGLSLADRFAMLAAVSNGPELR